MTQITSHVLDVSCGKPAAGIDITLLKVLDTEGSKIAQALNTRSTNSDGRVGNLCDELTTLHKGVYQLRFDLEVYFARVEKISFFPYADITFFVENPEEHYHVPLLLSPFGYSTYRGS